MLVHHRPQLLQGFGLDLAHARVRLQRLSPIGNCRNRPAAAENAANFFRRARGRRGPEPALTGGAAYRYADAMARRDLIAEKLAKAFAPASLDVVDESHQHAGHAGHREGGETHFRVYIVAEAFRGKSR